MSPRRHLAARTLAVLAASVLFSAAAPAVSSADVDPAGCTDSVQYDTSIMTWDQYYTANPGTGAIVPFASGAPGRSTGKNTNANISRYFDYVMTATQSNPRVRIVKRALGQSELGLRGVAGREVAYWILGTPENINDVEANGAFWAGVRDGTISEADGLAGVDDHPAFGWVTATPHGNEPAAGEAITRQLYEMAARTDCANARRLAAMDTILMPVRNPDGRDNNVRTHAFGHDGNRDFGTRELQEMKIFIPELNKYPGLFYIDAHQQTSGYFFPPNEDPVHHEISDFSLDFIQNDIGPTLQQTFNDQSSQYTNYNAYDLFTPEYGDTVPSLIMGAAGMTYEKGVDEAYGKQVYDHYLAIDTTINLTAKDKNNIASRWVEQWQEARDQGTLCQLQENKLVSPLHETINQQPNINVCGYFYRPGEHSGDVGKLMKNLQEVGVEVYRLDAPVNVAGLHEFGKADTTGTLPAGTLYIPMGQTQKHWIQAVLGEDPFIPYNYYYDVVTWSYSLTRGLAGNGFLTQQMPAGAQMTKLGPVALGSTPSSTAPVYVFNTDAMEALGLVTDLLAANVNVYRSSTAFDAGGNHYHSGAALVDGASVEAAGITLADYAADRNTPIRGLANYPVQRYQLVKPKIGLYTGAATVPSNPLNVVVSGGVPVGGTGQCGTSYCEALHVLTQKDEIDESLIVPVTSTDLSAGNLVSQNFTALINPGSTIAAGTGATALQAFINGGGRYVGANAGGATSARNAGVTALNTNTIAGLLTPGSTFDATFDVTSPVSWGFDRGGWIYRDTNGNPVFDPTTMGSAKAAVSYAATPLRSYGYQVNAVGPGRLDGRPAVVDQGFGAGRAIMLGFNPFFRSWMEQDERTVLNSVLYPTGSPIPASRATDETGGPAARAVDEAKDPIPAAKLPKVKSRPLAAIIKTDRDVIVKVARRHAAKLKAAVNAARLPMRVRLKVRYRMSRGTATLIIKGVRTGDVHQRQVYMSRLIKGLETRKAKIKTAQI